MKIQTIFCTDLSSAREIDHVAHRDEPQYQLCAECWCQLVGDCSTYAYAHQLAQAIRTVGLYKCIQSADNYSKVFLNFLDTHMDITESTLFSEVENLRFTIDQETIGFGLFHLWLQIQRSCTCFLVDHGSQLSDAARNHIVRYSLACQIVLRFPKRFTVCEPDDAAALRKFKEVNHASRAFGNTWYRWPGNYIMDLLKQNMREIMIPANVRKLNACLRRYATEPGHFSSGSCYYPNDTTEFGDGGISTDTNRTLALKYGFCFVDTPYFVTHSYLYGGLPLVEIPVTMYKVPGRFRNYDALVMPVPKDYETSREIAPETPLLNIEASRVRHLLVDLCTATGEISKMPPEDQSLNRQRAYEGSIPQENPYCTMDLSHASDSISRKFFLEVCPPELRWLIMRALSEMIVIDGELVYPGMLATSGSPLTPILQSIFFSAILRTACDLCGEAYDYSVYNDDLVVRRSVFQTACELLTLCGLTVNEKKTFSGNTFRESCGGEYCLGVDITGKYWPRKAIRLTVEPVQENLFPGASAHVAKNTQATLQTLISMQHHLYEFPTVRTTLESCIRDLLPCITFSPVGSEADDLWADWLDDVNSLRLPHIHFATEYDKQVNMAKRPWDKTRMRVGRAACEYYSYLDFLRHGPSYLDDLSRVLGISMRTSSYSMCDKVPSPVIVMDKPMIRETW